MKRPNRVQILDTSHGRIVQREWASPDISVMLGIDPLIEVTAQRSAASEGLAPEVLDFDPAARRMTMAFVEGVPLEADWMRRPQRRDAVRSLIERLRVMSAAHLPVLDLPERLRVLHARLAVRSPRLAARRLPEIEACLKSVIGEAGSQSATRDGVLVHGDLSPENIIVRTDGSLCLLDWEYAHRGHADEDLAGLALGEVTLGEWSVSPQDFGHRLQLRQVLDRLWLDLVSTLD